MRAKQKDGNINNGAPDNLEMLVPDFTRLTMENASDCIYWVDPAGNFVYVNKTAIQLLGYAKTEFLNMSVADIDPDFNTQNWIKYWEKLRTQTKVVMDVINKAKNGRTIHFEVASNYIRVGKKEYNCAFAHEITERRHMEEELRIQEARLANAMKIASLGNWEYDVVKDVFTFNDNFYAIFRTTAAQMGGYIMSPQDYADTFIHPEDRFLVASETRKAIETSDPYFVRKLEHRIIYADGKPGYITVRYFVVKDENGKTVKTYGLNQDNTERRQTQEALQRELEVKSALADLYSPLVSPVTPFHEIAYTVLEHAEKLTHSPHGCVSIIDPDSERYIGYTKIKLPPQQYRHSEDGKGIIFTNKRISLANAKNDYTDRDLSSVERLAEFYALAIQRKRIEDMIKASLEEKVLLLKEIHHRIKNNLQIVISLLHLQESYLSDEKTRGYFKDNQSRIRSMALIHEKLYRSGGFSEVNFADYVKRLAQDLIQVYRVNNNKVTLNLDIEKVTLKIDKAVPCGLLLNELVLNCLKHAFPGRKDNTIAITLKKTTGKKILLKVEDNGIGLPEHINLTNPASLGFGLVVSLSKQLNGQFGMSSRQGTKFRIVF
ncbi:MAG: histidine kinase dimerization/phosphoacceptor domain -containing protein [Spirochaetia bacterium]